ncbi:class I SAM-dependent methyltransferase [[Limnothrix rosea] IAM M-220]|uniref:class I SAM-dependent methyltransferase n=1 Tax=[Limnothrix rosea] IAM M-220 TaxID=454133 RepID=UPI000960ED8E|nr:class I SAM-dependent methyltransferase [[Limnothrix rosea] IAM M-220]OKH18857.1 hypothetical protein NIES208_03835 [[Limnothrix rosea] IAM M-220]
MDNKTSLFFESIPTSSSETERWDREWITYFNTEDPSPFLLNFQRLKPNLKIIKSLTKLSDKDVLKTSLVNSLPPLAIWSNGRDLVGKKVLEVGCGPGFLGKQLGLVCHSYLGIDYSQLALSIARLVSPSNCNYLHISDTESLLKQSSTIDTMVGRFFFIHQNFDNATWLLELANLLLKQDGIVNADFYKANLKTPQGVVFPAKSPLSEKYPSCAFEYTESEVQELADNHGFEIISTDIDREMQRLFVRFRKTQNNFNFTES